MAQSDLGFGRRRMDRGLDEIAAEMNADQDSSTGGLPFGDEYEERDYVGAPIRGMSFTNKRHTPYFASKTSTQASSLRNRDSGNRVFVANLSFATTLHTFKEHMRKGEAHTGIVFVKICYTCTLTLTFCLYLLNCRWLHNIL